MTSFVEFLSYGDPDPEEGNSIISSDSSRNSLNKDFSTLLSQSEVEPDIKTTIRPTRENHKRILPGIITNKAQSNSSRLAKIDDAIIPNDVEELSSESYPLPQSEKYVFPPDKIAQQADKVVFEFVKKETEAGIRCGCPNCKNRAKSMQEWYQDSRSKPNT